MFNLTKRMKIREFLTDASHTNTEKAFLLMRYQKYKIVQLPDPPPQPATKKALAISFAEYFRPDWANDHSSTNKIFLLKMS